MAYLLSDHLAYTRRNSAFSSFPIAVRPLILSTALPGEEAYRFTSIVGDGSFEVLNLADIYPLFRYGQTAVRRVLAGLVIAQGVSKIVST